MDIRSPNAHVIKQAYAQNRMYALEGTAIDADTNQIYARTSQGRFVRMDQTSQQLNILSADRRTFVMSRSLRPGEEILSGPNTPAMTHDVLLPPLTMRQQVGAWAPWIAATVGSFGLGYVAHAAFAAHAPAAHHPDTGTHHMRMLSGDFDAVGDYQMDDQHEVPVGGYDAVDASAYHTVVYDSSGTEWKDMPIGQKAMFCAVTGAGMTGGTLALGACVNGFVVQPIRGRLNERAARRSLEQFQAQQRASRQRDPAPQSSACIA